MRKTSATNVLIIILLIILTASVGMNLFQVVQMGKTRKEMTEQVTFYEENYSPMYEYFTGLSIEDFEEKVASGQRVVVYFGRPDCGDCLAFEPTFTTLIDELALSNELFYVNVKWKRESSTDAWNVFKEKYRFTQTPAFAVYEGGVQVDMIEWSTQGLPKSELKAWFIKNNIGTAPIEESTNVQETTTGVEETTSSL